MESVEDIIKGFVYEHKPFKYKKSIAFSR